MAFVNSWRSIFSKQQAAAEAEAANDEEAELLLGVPSSQASQPPDLLRIVTESLDIFKGILVVIMTWAHVEITLMSPDEQFRLSFAHLISNAAASLCFLGFMLSYGFSCDLAYISDWRRRSPEERTKRMLRSAMLPILGAWCCAFGWAWMCFKFPLDFSTLMQMLCFWLAPGNGPDFLLCFTICLLVMYSLRKFVNYGFENGTRLRIVCVAALLLVPLALSHFTIEDCMGKKRYLGFFFDCTLKEPWTSNLPALPHLFYFNLGLLLARGLRAFADSRQARTDYVASGIVFAVITAGLSYPLLTVWGSNFGNLSVPTKWGIITRGFVGGPSILWLLGNLFPVSALLVITFTLHNWIASSSRPLLWPVHFIQRELQNLGANILLYLIVADLCLAGLFRGQDFPLSSKGCAAMTFAMIAIGRLLQYLSNSGRPILTGCVTGGDREGL